jgi:hypothetical protein
MSGEFAIERARQGPGEVTGRLVTTFPPLAGQYWIVAQRMTRRESVTVTPEEGVGGEYVVNDFLELDEILD